MNDQNMTDYSSNSLLIIQDELYLLINEIYQVIPELNCNTQWSSHQLHHKMVLCAQTFMLLDFEYLAKYMLYLDELVEKIINDDSISNDISPDTILLKSSLHSLHHHLEIITLSGIKAPQALINQLNAIEIVLKKPVTTIAEYLKFFPNINKLPSSISITTDIIKPSCYIHLLYKLSLKKLLNNESNQLSQQALKTIAIHMTFLSQKQPSQSYWYLLEHVFYHFNDIELSNSIFQILIEIESNIYHFFKFPESHIINDKHFANLVYLCLTLNNDFSNKIKQELNIKTTVLTQEQLKKLDLLLAKPDLETTSNYCKIISKILIDIKSVYEKTDSLQEIQLKISQLHPYFQQLQLESEYDELQNECSRLEQLTTLNIASYNSLDLLIFKVLNQLEITKRQHLSPHMQFQINNQNLSIQFIDETYLNLLAETQVLIHSSVDKLYQHLNDQNVKSLENLPHTFKKIAYVFSYLKQTAAYDALILNTLFLEQRIKNQCLLEKKQIQLLLNSLASADLFIEHLKHNQAIPTSIFKVALDSSKTLRSTA